MDKLLNDLRIAARMLMKSPAFTLATTLALALGIGANTAVFSVLNGVVLRPLPYPEPERVFYLGWTWPGSNGTQPLLSSWKYDYFRRNTNIFEAVALHSEWTTEIGEGAVPVEARGLRASDGFFRVNGIEPSLGRGFLPEEDVPGAAPVAILSDRLWRETFDASQDVLGKTIRIGGESHTIVGVMPSSFRFPEAPRNTDFIVPYRLSPGVQDGAHVHMARVRLAAGVSRTAALAELRATSDRFRVDHPDLIGEEPGMSLLPFNDVKVGRAATALWMLFGAVGLVLLIACVNVANALLLRYMRRRQEIAIRATLGASKGRIARQLFAESLLLSLLAGLIGLLAANWTTDVLLALAPAELARADEVGLDLRVFALTLAIAMAIGVGFGCIGVFEAGRVQVANALHESTLRHSGGRRGRRIRSVLVAAEAAIASVLLIGAGLLVGRYVQLRSVELGINPDNVLVGEFGRTPSQYSATQVWALEQAVLERVRTLPNVVYSATANRLPLRGQFNRPMTVSGRPDATSGDTQWRSVSSDYFRAAGITVVQGRGFELDDESGEAASAVIINEAFARMFFPNENPLGEYLVIGTYRGQPTNPNFRDPERVIIGVSADVHELGLDQVVMPTMYVPRAQLGRAALPGQQVPAGLGGIMIRYSGDQAALAQEVSRIIGEVDPRAPVPIFESMGDVVGVSVSRERFQTLLTSVFASLALALAALGINAVVGFSVQQRTNEIGVRLALGADRGSLRLMVVRQAMFPLLAGLAVGIASAWLLAQFIGESLYGSSNLDPRIVVSSVLLLVAVGAVAAYAPARRASTLNPVAALRDE